MSLPGAVGLGVIFLLVVIFIPWLDRISSRGPHFVTTALIVATLFTAFTFGALGLGGADGGWVVGLMVLVWFVVAVLWIFYEMRHRRLRFKGERQEVGLR